MKIEALIPAPTVQNMDQLAHFMWADQFARQVEIWLGDDLLARSFDPLRVTEVNDRVLTPVIYLPASDVRVPLTASGVVTSCPIKGKAETLDWADQAGIAWRYVSAVPGAEALLGRVGFDAARVTVCDAPI